MCGRRAPVTEKHGCWVALVNRCSAALIGQIFLKSPFFVEAVMFSRCLRVVQVQKLWLPFPRRCHCRDALVGCRSATFLASVLQERRPITGRHMQYCRAFPIRRRFSVLVVRMSLSSSFLVVTETGMSSWRMGTLPLRRRRAPLAGRRVQDWQIVQVRCHRAALVGGTSLRSSFFVVTKALGSHWRRGGLFVRKPRVPFVPRHVYRTLRVWIVKHCVLRSCRLHG